jgi:isoleucyl-tRNA synthetase
MSERPDYRDTVFLPKTDFPMKAGLSSKEPAILARWAEMGLYKRLREERAGRERFILHDGPPYANGDIHIGHAMMKTIKDFILRSQTLLGKDAPFIPGWDCHGLPIEWKIEEQYRKKKLDKDQVPPREFRAECRAYAEHWIQVQREQFIRLGITGDWDDPYRTMDFTSEAKIAEELLKLAEAGKIYRGAKPVMWSPVEKTALAEAEVEYEDIVSTQIDVGFYIEAAPLAPELRRTRAVVWTTTPWTIPVNQAIAYNPDIDYALIEEGGVDARYLVAWDLVDEFQRRTGRVAGDVPTRIEGRRLEGAIAHHPMHRLGGFFARPRPFLPGDFVTTDQGTGLVHMSPDHGEDDFLLCKAHGIDPVFAVDAGGFYRADWEWLGGQGSVINNKFNAPDGPICSDLREAGGLLAASADFEHSYPHSWRSKAKVIYRCTPQWFIPMDGRRGKAEQPQSVRAEPVEALPSSEQEGSEALRQAQGERSGSQTLRQTALKAIDETRWVPEKAENRMRSMVENRPDWVLSRQRAWGVPIPLYLHKKSGDYLRDAAVNSRILRAFHEGGADAWFDADHQGLLGNGYRLEEYEPVTDILDVWFDSGSTHAFVVEARYGPDVRADLYCEGSDQHRGWFQASLLESCATRGRAPFGAVLTHGFALDQNGRKMSKSIGNTVDPIAIIRDSGADILRLWVASTDYFEDVRIGKEILAGTTDAYRKLRNTFRYLLGALAGFDESERVPAADMPELERWVLHRLAEIDAELKDAVQGFDFNRYTRLIMAFANDDLSAFFFDIRKDSLYCDAPASLKRRAYRTVLDTVFHALARWLAPVLCFTTEEVWQTRFPDEGGSVHLLEWPAIDSAWHNEALGEKWALIRCTRENVTESIEPLRREKVIGSSLEAKVLYPSVQIDMLDTNLAELAEIYIVSEVGESESESIEVTKSDYLKCGRCWRLLPEVSDDGGLCARCEGVVNG